MNASPLPTPALPLNTDTADVAATLDTGLTNIRKSDELSPDVADIVDGWLIAAEPLNKLDPEVAETEVTGLTFAANDAVEFSDATTKDVD